MDIGQNFSLNLTPVVADNSKTSVSVIPDNEKPEKFIPAQDNLKSHIKKGTIPSSECYFVQGHEKISIVHEKNEPKKLTKKEKKQLKDQIISDSMVTCGETIATAANQSLKAVVRNSGHLSAPYKLMNQIGNLPFIIEKGISTAITSSYKIGHQISPITTEIISESIKEGVEPVVKTLPIVNYSLRKNFPKAYSYAGKAISVIPVVSSTGFAIFDTINAKNLINNDKSSSETKKYAVATASLSYISTAASATLVFASKFGSAAPKVAAVSSGLGIITFAASIYTSVKMEWSKNKDGIQ